MTAAGFTVVSLGAERVALTLAAARDLAERVHANAHRPTVYVYEGDDPWPVDVLRGGAWTSAVPA